MEKQKIKTIEDIKGGYFGYTYAKGRYAGYDLYVAEIADPDDNGTGWESGEWFLIKGNDAIRIACCDGYNGIEWLINDDELLELMGDEDIVDEIKDAVQPYNITGELIAAAKEATLEDASADYDGEVAIWVTRCYSDGTIGAPVDGFVTDDNYGTMVFLNATEAQEYINELESGTYVLSHGEMGRPTYRIVKY